MPSKKAAESYRLTIRASDYGVVLEETGSREEVDAALSTFADDDSPHDPKELKPGVSVTITSGGENYWARLSRPALTPP